MTAEVFSLNAHASYACRHSGACCTAGWTIPVEAHLLPIVGTDWLEPDDTGACRCYDRDGRRCTVQREGGEAMLPRSCYHFPRRALLDSRGTSVALSLFCPTAAALLLDAPGPLRIVRQPAAFPAAREYEGLDAREEWPPLLRPDVLFDPPSYALWEQHMVEAVASSSRGVDDTLLDLAVRAEALRAWTSDDGPLEEWTRVTLASSAEADADALARRYGPFTGHAAHAAAIAAVPAGLSFPAAPHPFEALDTRWVASAWTTMSPLVLRVLGAKAFASWTAYQSRGVRTQVAELFMTAAVLRVECVRACATAQRPLDAALLADAVREMDRLLVHLVEREQLLPWLGKAELDDEDARTRR